MDEESKQETLRILNQALSEQNAIMNKHAPRAINPDNSEEYKNAKRGFDAAYKNIQDIEKQIAYLLTAETYEPPILDKILNIVDKIISDDDDWKDQSSAYSGFRG